MSEFRFILTQECCYRCPFCHHEGIENNREECLNAEDYSILFSVGHNYFSINEATLSGGEPLCRKDIIQIARSLYDCGCKTTLTTNGYRLSENIEIGKYLSTINISLISVEKDTYRKLVGVDDAFESVINNINLTRTQFPRLSMCLNIPAIKEVIGKQGYITKIINIAEEYNATIKFIELYPSSMEGYIPKKQIEQLLIDNNFIKIPSNSRASCFLRNNIVVRVTQIFCACAKSKGNPDCYCNKYNDIFLTPDGKIKVCRQGDFEIDILQATKNRLISDLRKKITIAYKTLGMNCRVKEQTIHNEE